MDYEAQASAREVVVREFNSLRGRLCSIIESADLPKKQERALITLIKNCSYQNQAVVVDLIDLIDPDHERQFEYIRKLKKV